MKTKYNRQEITLFDKQNKMVTKIHHEGDMISLTDLWREAGSHKDKTPNDWANIASNQQLIDTVANMLNTAHNGIIKSKRGKGGGTWAHKQIALAYAKYLDPKLHILVNEVFFQRVEEEKNPDLIVDRAISTYKRKGKSDVWIKQRLDGKLSRNHFTAILAEHKVVGKGYSKCTNAIYNPLFGGDAVLVREKYGIERSKNIRDNLPMLQLAAIQFSETLASDDIEKNNRLGNAQCERASRIASNVVRNALLTHKKNVVT